MCAEHEREHEEKPHPRVDASDVSMEPSQLVGSLHVPVLYTLCSQILE